MTQWTFGPFRLDPVARRLTRDGVEVEIQPLQLKLLEYAVVHAGELLERDALMQLLWPDVHVTEHSLTQTVHRLRHILDPHADWLRTVPRLGFRFVGPIAGAERADPDRFFGRATELDTLDTLWRDGARHVALLGPGGAGKTRLALEHLQRADARWRWVIRVDLVPVTSAAGFVAAVAGALGVRLHERGGPDGSVRQVGASLAHRGPGVALLDNLEQLLPDAEGVLAEWHAAAPDARWLMTSRVDVGLPSSRTLELPPLAIEEGRALFLDRARSAGAALDGVPVDDVDELVAALEGSPLAIELAAARSPLLDPASLRARIGRGVLTRARGPDRHRSMQAVIEGSWELLTPREQRVLSQCALFAGPFTVGQAEVVADPGDPPVLDVLEALRGDSLLERAATQASPVAGRLRLATLVRQFARERLPAGDPAYARFVSAMRDRARVAEDLDLEGEVPESRALLADVPSLVAAANLADDPADRVAIVSPTARWLRALGRLADATELVCALPDPPPAELRALVLLARAEGEMYASTTPGRLDDVLAEARNAETSGAVRLAGDLFLVAGRTFVLSGRATEGRDAALQAVECYERAGPEAVPWKAWACFNAGVGALMLSGVEEAEAFVTRGLEACGPGVAPRVRASLLDLRAHLFGLAGRYDEAEHFYSEAARLEAERGLALQRLNTLSNLAASRQHAGRLAEAVAAQDEAIAEAARLGLRSLHSLVLNNRAVTHMHIGDLPRAEADLLASRALLAPGDWEKSTLIAGNMATLEALRGRWDPARRAAEEALHTATKAGHRLAQADALLWALVADVGAGDQDRAQARIAALDALGTHDLPGFEIDAIALARAAARGDTADVPDSPVARLVRRALGRRSP